MTLTDDDIARGLELCERAPKEIETEFIDGGSMQSGNYDPTGASHEFYETARTLLPAALAELKAWRPVIEAAKAWQLAQRGYAMKQPKSGPLRSSSDVLRDAIDAALAQESKP